MRDKFVTLIENFNAFIVTMIVICALIVVSLLLSAMVFCVSNIFATFEHFTQ